MDILYVIVGAVIFLVGLQTGLQIRKNEAPERPEPKAPQPRTPEQKVTFGSGGVKPMKVKEIEQEKLYGEEQRRARELIDGL